MNKNTLTLTLCCLQTLFCSSLQAFSDDVLELPPITPAHIIQEKSVEIIPPNQDILVDTINQLPPDIRLLSRRTSLKHLSQMYKDRLEAIIQILSIRECRGDVNCIIRAKEIDLQRKGLEYEQQR